MPHFLLLETSTDICSVAWSNGQTVLAERETRVYHEHGRKLTGFIEEVAREASCTLDDLAAIGVSRGPGSFTSLRIGIATAKGLAYALQKPLLALDAFAGMATQAQQVHPAEAACYVPLVDARSMGVFVAVYGQDASLQLPVTRQQLTPDFLLEQRKAGTEIIFCGPGAEKYRTQFGEQNISYLPAVLPRAAALQKQALRGYKAQDFVDLAYFEPHYIAPPNITTPKKRLPRNRI